MVLRPRPRARIHRATHERWTVRHLQEPSKKGEMLERAEAHHAPTWTNPGRHAEL